MRAAALSADSEPGWSWQRVSQKPHHQRDVARPCGVSPQTWAQHECVCVFKPFQRACPGQSQTCNLSLPHSCLGCTLLGTRPLTPKGQLFWLAQTEHCEILWLEKWFIHIQNYHLSELTIAATRNIFPCTREVYRQQTWNKM